MGRDREKRRRNWTVLSGTDEACRVGQGCCDRLERHHVHPLACGGADSEENTVVLCRRHHALIERFYWWRRCGIDPLTTSEILQIARRFDRKLVPPLMVQHLKAETDAAWDFLNEKWPFSESSWWRSVFSQAVTWARTQMVTRDVAPSNAIIEEPWFRPLQSSIEVLKAS